MPNHDELTSAAVRLASAQLADARCESALKLAQAMLLKHTRDLLFASQDLVKSRAAIALQACGEKPDPKIKTVTAAFAAEDAARGDLHESEARVTALGRHRGETLQAVENCKSAVRKAREQAVFNMLPDAVAAYHAAAEQLARAATRINALSMMSVRVQHEVNLGRLHIPALPGMSSCDGVSTYEDSNSLRGAGANQEMLRVHRELDQIELQATTAPDDDLPPVVKDQARVDAAKRGHQKRVAAEQTVGATA